jgi:hypothetical protein
MGWEPGDALAVNPAPLGEELEADEIRIAGKGR